MLFIAFHIAAQNIISDVHITYCYENTPNLKKITYTIIMVCLLFGYFVGTEVSLCMLWTDINTDERGRDMRRSYD